MKGLAIVLLIFTLLIFPVLTIKEQAIEIGKLEEKIEKEHGCNEAIAEAVIEKFTRYQDEVSESSRLADFDEKKDERKLLLNFEDYTELESIIEKEVENCKNRQN